MKLKSKTASLAPNTDLDYYMILGAAPSATYDELHTKFKALCVRYHPDRGGDAEKYKQVSRAYSVLKDPGLRAEYDERIRMLVPPCATCGGSGVEKKTGRNFQTTIAQCSSCGGTGRR